MLRANRFRSAHRARRYGFTLVELMTVVAIVGILATIGIILVRQHLRSGKTVEAMSIMQAIRAAQESRRAETGQYLNVSTSNKWYPATPDGKLRRSFVFAHDDSTRWQQLGVSRTDGTQFGFKTFAGVPGPVTGFTLSTSKAVTFPDATDNWYVIEAAGDIDQDGVLSAFAATSFSSEVFVENDSE